MICSEKPATRFTYKSNLIKVKIDLYSQENIELPLINTPKASIAYCIESECIEVLIYIYFIQSNKLLKFQNLNE